MRKPEHQWETPSFRAVRREALPESWAAKPRAEAFDLKPQEPGEGPDLAGKRGPTAWLSLTDQIIDRAAFDRDGREVVFAVMAWLVARGARAINLRDELGEPVARGPFEVSLLSSEAAKGAVPARLITLAPSNAELIAAVGCVDRLIACEDSSDWPAELATLERLGPDLNPDLDRVVALKPDLVLSSLSVPGMERIVTGLRRRGVPQLVFAPRRIDDVLANLETLGTRLGVAQAARAARAKMTRERAALLATRGPTPLRVYLEWWPRPMFTPGADCFSNELIELAGGINVFGDREGSSVEITPEDLHKARPDVCFVSWCGVSEDKLDLQNLIKRPGLERLKAALWGHVFTLDERFSGRPGPRMLEAARIMARGIERVRSSIGLDNTMGH